MKRRAKATPTKIDDASRNVNDDPIPGITAADVSKAYASMPTYRFNGACGPFQMSGDESSFERWCVQTGRDDLSDESAAIYDGSKDAFASLCRRHGVMRSYAIVDTVAGVTAAFDDALPDFGTIVKEFLSHIEEMNGRTSS